MDFDTIIDRRNTHCSKWDQMQNLYGVSPEDGLAMWVADMDFRPPASVQRALQQMLDHGIYGYYGDEADYRTAVCWWMKTRHHWEIDPSWIFTTHGLVNGAAICIDTWSQPGDGIVLMTPVYHAFHRIIKAADRKVVELPLAEEGGRYVMDFEAWEGRMTGSERIMLFCSPHNPGGRVWSAEELRGVADFCRRHDLILVSDEIHHDLIYPGHKHLPMALAAPDLTDRLVTMTATSKTFNIAGAHTGNVIIADPILRAEFAKRMNALGISGNSFGLTMATAAYSPEGAEWLDALLDYLDGNRKLFDAGIAEIPGLRSMPLEGTYLAWVDFSGTGMDRAELQERVAKTAKIAANEGSAFGTGGEQHLRFNLATPRARVEEALRRLKAAFADLQ